VLLNHVPTHGALAHSAREMLQAYKEQHGTEQNDLIETLFYNVFNKTH
jgi:hypothetical protein